LHGMGKKGEPESSTKRGVDKNGHSCQRKKIQHNGGGEDGKKVTGRSTPGRKGIFGRPEKRRQTVPGQRGSKKRPEGQPWPQRSAQPGEGFVLEREGVSRKHFGLKPLTSGKKDRSCLPPKRGEERRWKLLDQGKGPTLFGGGSSPSIRSFSRKNAREGGRVGRKEISSSSSREGRYRHLVPVREKNSLVDVRISPNKG